MGIRSAILIRDGKEERLFTILQQNGALRQCFNERRIIGIRYVQRYHGGIAYSARRVLNLIGKRILPGIIANRRIGKGLVLIWGKRTVDRFGMLHRKRFHGMVHVAVGMEKRERHRAVFERGIRIGKRHRRVVDAVDAQRKRMLCDLQSIGHREHYRRISISVLHRGKRKRIGIRASVPC